LDRKIREFVDKKLTCEYKQDNDEEFVEIHVDYLYSYGLNDKDLPPLGKFGGNQSVQLPTDQKARLFFGQDEAAYRSSSPNEKCWTINGQFELRSKGIGQGIMVSALVSRALGMGIDISVEQLEQVSSNREGAKDVDEEAASYQFGIVTICEILGNGGR
jgi:hypothetical protein